MAIVLVRGTGDVGSAVAHRLFSEGHSVLLHDRPRPSHARRGMAFTDSLFIGYSELEGILAKRAHDLDGLRRMLQCRRAIPVSDRRFEALLEEIRPDVLVDARMRKREVPERQRGLAPLVIGLGPNCRPGENVDVAIETAHGASLGAVIRSGATSELAGEPQALDGHGRERFVYAPRAGTMHTSLGCGDRVSKGMVVGDVDGEVLLSPLDGWLRGLASDGAEVELGAKIVEVQTGRPNDTRGLAARPSRIAQGVADVVSCSRAVLEKSPQRDQDA